MADGFVGVRITDLDDASRSQERCAALLKRLARSSLPVLSPSLLVVFARLATPACRWLDGDIAIELFAEEEGTRIRILADLGVGQRERVLPPVLVPVELEALVATAERIPALLGPLRLERISSRCVLLVADEVAPVSTGFAISESCLRHHESELDIDARWADAS